MSKKETLEAVERIKDEYKAARVELQKKYETKLRDVAVPYAIEISKFKVGDIIKCDGKYVRIDKIGAQVLKDDIIPVYHGPVLTPKLREKRNGETLEIHDDCLIEKI